jgi:ADP-ribosylglycohydrolase
MVGDILGAAVEGWPIDLITSRYNGKLKDFIHAKHMGAIGVRFGMYTDDTNSALALASSIVENKALVPKHAAMQYAKFYKESPYPGFEIGYPPSAMHVMESVLKGVSYRETGTVSFKDGSFANGGVMRICPVGLAFRNATDEELYAAAKWAVISSHVHPEAVDGTWLQAKAVSILVRSSHESLQPADFLKNIKDLSKNPEMDKQLAKIVTFFDLPEAERPTPQVVVAALGDDFQIRAVEAFPSALWAVVTNWRNPEQCIIDAVNLGGDTDTIGCIAGAMIGALHGHKWIPARWWSNIEDGKRGRSYCIELAKQLAALDLHEVQLD